MSSAVAAAGRLGDGRRRRKQTFLPINLPLLRYSAGASLQFILEISDDSAATAVA